MLLKRFKRNAQSDVLNIEVKDELNLHSYEDICTKGWKYLGVDYKVVVEGHRRYLLTKPSKLHEWLKDEAPQDGKMTARAAAAVIGKALFATMIDSESLLTGGERGRPLIRTASYVASRVKTQKGWDSKGVYVMIPVIWEQLRNLEKIRTSGTSRCCARSMRRRRNRTKGGNFRKDDTRHILLKEMDAVIKGVQAAT